MAALVNRIESRRQSNDCATWALAVYLGIPYEDVWQIVQRVDRSKGRNGLRIATIRRVAKALGFTLRFLRSVDDDAYGILSVEDKTSGHVAVLRSGLVFDTDSTVWERDDWLKSTKYRVQGILVVSA
jgi:hypothetical protein